MLVRSEHTIKAFDEEIGRLRTMISEMGGHAETAIAGAMNVLVQHNLAGAAKIVEDDRKIDALETEVERLAVQIIALRAPMADDLREVVAALKIAGVVERIGDYAKNIAKRVAVLDGNRKIEAVTVLIAMSQIAGEMVHDVLDAFAARDIDKAIAVIERDQSVDDFYNSVFRLLVTFMMENPQSISNAAHLLFIAKNLERIGDHATNVAEMVYFAATGDHLADRERADDMIGENRS
ncbi:MAG: phosphate signaling complex protein PhoU [Sphingomonadaceae bacterium]